MNYGGRAQTIPPLAGCLDPDCKRPGPDVTMLQTLNERRYARRE